MQVSVICPVYNTAPQFLREAVGSVLRDNAGLVGEMILVDDCSTAAPTTAALAAIARDEQRIVLIQTDRNVGPASARNIGLAAAKCDWISFIDADDIWLPERSQIIAAALSSRPEAEWFGASYCNLLADGRFEAGPRICEAVAFEAAGVGVFLLPPAKLTPMLIGDAWFVLGAHLFRKSLLAAAGGFTDHLFYHEDGLLMTKVASLSTCVYTNADVYAYRRGHASLMSRTARLSSAYVRMYQVAKREKLLRRFRRQLRWARYDAYKGIAFNNLLWARRLHAAYYAARAYLTDPREVQDLAAFLRLSRKDRDELLRVGRLYSRAARFIPPPEDMPVVGGSFCDAADQRQSEPSN